MTVLGTDTLTIATDDDVVRARQHTRQRAVECGFGLVDQTKLVTAASELARNTLIHGGGGTMIVDVLNEGGRRGVRLTFVDAGPGIRDVEAALRPGFTTGSGLGLGLSGARKLVDQFSLDSRPGAGTHIVVVKWK
jgi:serine/threonine-protein kinase RsbT